MGQGIDKNFISYADVDGVVHETDLTPPDDTYADTLKLSHATNVTVRGCRIVGGNEDAIDCNRYCANVLVHDVLLAPRTNGVTIKGGTTNVTLKNVTFENHGKSFDIELGEWSDQSNAMSTGLRFENVSAKDGKPVRVLVMWAEKPTVVGGNVKLIVIPKPLCRLYMWMRKRHLAP